jgi:hypothetical protein
MQRPSADRKNFAFRSSDASSDNDAEMVRDNVFIKAKQPSVGLDLKLNLKAGGGQKLPSANLAAEKTSFVSDLEKVFEDEEVSPSKKSQLDLKKQFFDFQSEASSSMSFDNSSKLTPDMLQKHNESKFNLESGSEFLDSEQAESSGSEDNEALLAILAPKDRAKTPEPIALAKGPTGVSFRTKPTLAEAAQKDARLQDLTSTVQKGDVTAEIKDDRLKVSEFKLGPTESSQAPVFKLDLSKQAEPHPQQVRAKRPSLELEVKASPGFAFKPDEVAVKPQPRNFLPALHSKPDLKTSSVQPPEGSSQDWRPEILKNKPVGVWDNFSISSKSDAEELFKNAKPHVEHRQDSKFEIKPMPFEQLNKQPESRKELVEAAEAFRVSSSESENFEIKTSHASVVFKGEAPKPTGEASLESKQIVIPQLPLGYQKSEGLIGTTEVKFQATMDARPKVIDGKPRPSIIAAFGVASQPNSEVYLSAQQRVGQNSASIAESPSPPKVELSVSPAYSAQAPIPSPVSLPHQAPHQAPQVPSSVSILRPSGSLEIKLSPAEQGRSESIQFDDIMNDLGKVDLSSGAEDSKSAEKTGCWGCFTSFFGCGTEELGENHRQIRNRVLALSRPSLKPDDRLHQRMLHAFWRYASRSHDEVPLMGDHWRRIGFTENNPCAELKESGLLTMVMLLTISSKFPKLTQEIIFYSRSPSTVFAWAALGGRFTLDCLECLRKGKMNATFNMYPKTPSLFSSVFCGAYLHWFRLFSKQPETGIELCYAETKKLLMKSSDQLLEELRVQMEEENK